MLTISIRLLLNTDIFQRIKNYVAEDGVDTSLSLVEEQCRKEECTNYKERVSIVGLISSRPFHLLRKLSSQSEYNLTLMGAESASSSAEKPSNGLR